MLSMKLILSYLIFIIDSTAVSIFVVILVELTNTAFVNSINITINIKYYYLREGVN